MREQRRLTVLRRLPQHRRAPRPPHARAAPAGAGAHHGGVVCTGAHRNSGGADLGQPLPRNSSPSGVDGQVYWPPPFSVALTLSSSGGLTLSAAPLRYRCGPKFASFYCWGLVSDCRPSFLPLCADPRPCTRLPHFYLFACESEIYLHDGEDCLILIFLVVNLKSICMTVQVDLLSGRVF
jgi:hypothetical protein